MWLDAMTFVDALYFTVVTATTVGFGDYVPSSTGAKVFSLFYVPLSVVMVAGALQQSICQSTACCCLNPPESTEAAIAAKQISVAAGRELEADADRRPTEAPLALTLSMCFRTRPAASTDR